MAVIQESDIFIPTKIRDILNDAGGNVTDYLPTFFQYNARLNTNSKYIPIIHEEPIKLTESQWKEANYGFVINGYSTYTPNSKWLRPLPSGTVLQPMRLSDFIGYSTDEEAPIKLISPHEQTWNKFIDETPNLSATLAYKIGGNSIHGYINNRLNIEDLKISNNGTWDFKDLYLIVAYDADHYVTCEYPLSSGNQGGTISSILGTSLAIFLKSAAIDKSYTLYCFLTTRPSSAAGWSIPLPVVTTINYSIVRKYWLKFHITAATVRVGDVQVGSVSTGSAITYWGQSKRDYVLGLTDSTPVTITYTIQVRRTFTTGENSINLKTLRIQTPLNDNNVIIDSAMILHLFKEGGSMESILKQLRYSDPSPIYHFAVAGDWHSTYPYYNISVTCSSTAKLLKGNAEADKTMPMYAGFGLLPSFILNGEGIPAIDLYTSQDLQPYRFVDNRP